ncbi:hypothetical protein GCM10018955_17390 [Planomonospora venezuelensis]
MLLGRREDVEQPAPDRDLAALLHHVHAVVAVLHQPVDHGVEVGVVARAQPYRRKVAEPAHDRLEHRPDRGDDDPQRSCRGVALDRVGQAAQYGQALADGVAARGEPLVREGLPGGEDGDRVPAVPLSVLPAAGARFRAEQAGQRRREVLGLAAGRGHRQHGPARLPGQRGRGEGPQRGRGDERGVGDAGGAALPRVREGGGQLRLARDKVQQSGKAHQFSPTAPRRQHDRPPAAGARGVTGQGYFARLCDP